MAIIEIDGLAKSYRVYQKQEGLLASVRGLFRRSYREVVAVDGIDLRVEAGEFVAFLGPNGAGKTTTLKLLSGVINPTHGTARVMGHVPWKRENAYRRRFALVMGQKNQLWWDLPAQESFRLHQQIYCIEPAQFDRRRDELVDLLQVRQLLGQPVRELSLGERMKMELIAALLHSPEVLFLDEPTIGLDVVAQHSIQSFLRHYQQIAQSDGAVDQPLHERRGGAVPSRGDHRPRADHVRRLARRHCRPVQRPQDHHAGVPQRHACPAAWSDSATVLDQQGPKVKLKVDRNGIGEALASILAQHTVEDVSVEDPPLEEVIAEVFSLASNGAKHEMAKPHA